MDGGNGLPLCYCHSVIQLFYYVVYISVTYTYTSVSSIILKVFFRIIDEVSVA